ncbi:unnamed protein product [Caenorhabditis bovis]|uniref:WAP domain-containing protein n=1 Tax=Caenorhabditis bovis TaxID=2654633 RepID=A0A8S1EDZ3_9PELO|nr:unnamed protein product [Caenorhabditis bovis]
MSLIQLTVLTISVVGAQHMTLCDYFEKLGIAKPECGHIVKPIYEAPPPPIFGAFSSRKTVNAWSGGLMTSLPLCQNYFHSCMASTACESGTICTSGLAHGSCCTNPNRASCPTATSMNINCRKTRSVNWCNTDTDCRGTSTTASMCCPTGCNYNMCVYVGHQIVHPRRSVVFSSLRNTQINDGTECPDPYTMDIKCLAPRGANWCHTDDECLSGINKRKCCATLCGYNTCVMRLNNNKWIIA